MDDDAWLKFEYQLLYAEGFKGRDGSVVKLNHTDKNIYLYVRSRVEFFNRIGGVYFESHAVICNKLCISQSTMTRWLRMMTENGIVECRKVRTRKGIGYNYIKVNDMHLIHKKLEMDEWEPDPVNLEDIDIPF